MTGSGSTELRSTAEARQLIDRLNSWTGARLVVMEVCGTHTMAAARFGLHQLLPERIRLVSGPGCPVCVTPVGYLDHALALAADKDVILTTFGDLMRVPGSVRDEGAIPSTLTAARAVGADVRVVYSPLGALELAARNPKRQVVFCGVGFETTAPALAAAVLRADQSGLVNFSLLAQVKTIPGALEVLATADEIGLSGLLLPGHVSVVIGSEAYRPLAEKHGVPGAISGFEPVEMLRGLAALLDQIAAGKARVDNCYPGAVLPRGNPKALAMIQKVFEPQDSVWRGLGPIPASGLGLRPELARYDAEQRFPVELPPPVEPRGCRCGDVLRGMLDPADCGLFGTACTPENPQGACMVSSEGSCAARYHYAKGE